MPTPEPAEYPTVSAFSEGSLITNELDCALKLTNVSDASLSVYSLSLPSPSSLYVIKTDSGYV